MDRRGDPRPDGEDVMMRNRALRQWAAGLRERSRSAREVSAVRRERAHRVGETRRPVTLSLPAAPDPAGASAALAAASRASRRVLADAHQPSLGEVTAAELRAVLVGRHGFSEAEGERALATGMLIAGYPADHPSVSGVDALEVIEHALRHQW